MTTENVLIKSIKLPKYSNIAHFRISPIGLTIDFFNDRHLTIFYTLRDEHIRECCEEVYAEWDVVPLNNYLLATDAITDEKEPFFTHLDLIGVPGIGFMIHLKVEGELGTPHKYLVPCHNSQNGCYSSNLDLFISGSDEFISLNGYLDNIDSWA